MAGITLETVYKELQDVKKELRMVKHALIPLEKISSRERKELHETLSRMKKGDEKSFREVFKK